jgi:enterochelin esterase-like enzyme
MPGWHCQEISLEFRPVKVRHSFYRSLMVLGLLLPTSAARAQPPAAAPPAADNLVSPEVLADGRVTFRLRAPKATVVKVVGEWTQPKANSPLAMTRDPAGTWSLTVGPLEPNIYIYVFDVDGAIVTDPVNPLVKLRARTSASMVEVPGGKLWEARDVPHGRLTMHTHAATALGGVTRQLFVYTPPGYEKNRAGRYPLLYLLHGNNDLAAGWTMAGRAHFILDNLLAEKKAVPMIVVMPWGHALPFGSRPAAGQPSNNDLFAQYLMKDVVPLVEGSYRIGPGRRHRAVVGLSMGGAQALQIVLAHRDRFGQLGIFGAGLDRKDFEDRHGAALAPPADRAPRPELVFIGVGKDDGVRPRAKQLAEALTERGFAVTYHETDGGHTYPVWRKLLVEAAPLLFQNSGHR